MENKTGKVYNLKITTFSPVHIGDNEDFEPACYVIVAPNITEQSAIKSVPQEETIVCPECNYVNSIAKLDKKLPRCLECESDLELPKSPAKTESKNVSTPQSSSYLYTFTPKHLSEALSDADKKKLLSIAKEGDYTSLQKFFKDNAHKIVRSGVKHSEVCAEIAKQYADKCGNFDVPLKDRNKFIIEKNISNPSTDIAYIPGSSLKGAIRTALMTAKNNKRQHPFTYKDAEMGKDKKGNIKYSAKFLEQKLYGYKKQTEDPFKYLKISDTLSQEGYYTKIWVAKNYDKSAQDNNGTLPTFMELIPRGIIFKSQLSVACKFADDINTIKEACNKFYSNIMALEKSYINIPNKQNFYDELKHLAQKPNTFIIRIGKHGGAENVTIDGIRRIQINHGMNKDKNKNNGQEKKKEILDHSTTYWLAEDGREKLPFGWCVVEFEEVK